MVQLQIKIDSLTHAMLLDTAEEIGLTVEQVAAMTLQEQREAVEAMRDPIVQALHRKLKSNDADTQRFIQSVKTLIC